VSNEALREMLLRVTGALDAAGVDYLLIGGLGIDCLFRGTPVETTGREELSLVATVEVLASLPRSTDDADLVVPRHG
jgi:hypothetical protein